MKHVIRKYSALAVAATSCAATILTFPAYAQQSTTGIEGTVPTEDFVPYRGEARRLGLGFEVHAGEMGPPSSIVSNTLASGSRFSVQNRFGCAL